MSGRKIRADRHKRVSSTGYNQMQGDLEVQGKLLGPEITKINAAIAKISATSTTPVKLGAPEALGEMRAISLRWGRQYNLTNFDHYELQVSDDDESWYSLQTDGSGWKIDLNESTHVKTEYYVHANIPLITDAGDLVGKTLYYRVRQVTKLGDFGAWSESGYATTKPVEDLVIKDTYSRYIEISSKKGIYADDRQGHIIHDIPNAPILTGMVYGGHAIIKDSAAYIGYCQLMYADTDTIQQETSATVNTTVAEHLGDLTNAKGALIAINHHLSLAANKTTATTLCTLKTCYSTVYNAVPVVWNEMGYDKLQFQGVVGAAWEYHISHFCIAPITWNAGIPYVTWNFYISCTDMSANNVIYSFLAELFLLGVTV